MTSTQTSPAQDALAMLRAFPRARVAALSDLGMFVPLPPSVPLTRTQIPIEGHSSTLSLVSAAEVMPVVKAWHRARQHGRADVDLHPLVSPDTVVTLSFFDTRDVYGTYLAVIVGPGAELISATDETDPFLRPRVTTARHDEAGVYTAADGSLPLILGYPDIVGTGVVDLVHPDDVNRAVGVWMDMLAKPGCSRRMRYRHRHHDGGFVWLEATMRNLLNDPHERSVVVDLLDISEEMAAHEHVVAQENLLRRLTESLPVGIVQVDPRGRIVHRNPEIARLFGHPEAETLDELLVDLAEEDAGKLADATRGVLADVDVDIEIGVVPSADDVRRYQVILRALPDASGGPSGFIVCVSDVTEPARLRDRLHHRATRDAMTGCHNRAAALHHLEQLIAAGQDGSGVGVVFIDLDGFKLVNDRRGHAAGDALLSDIGACLNRLVRPGDVVGRFGGDEFLVICDDTASPDQVLGLARRLAAALSEAFSGEPPHSSVASFGVAWMPRPQADPGAAETLIGWADSAMYDSKAAGDGRVVLFGA